MSSRDRDWHRHHPLIERCYLCEYEDRIDELTARLARLGEAARPALPWLSATAGMLKTREKMEEVDAIVRALRAALDGEGQDDRSLPSSSKVAPVGSDVRSGQMPEPAPTDDDARASWCMSGTGPTLRDAANACHARVVEALAAVRRETAEQERAKVRGGPRPFCRDCADEDGICPTSGEPCDQRDISQWRRALVQAHERVRREERKAQDGYHAAWIEHARAVFAGHEGPLDGVNFIAELQAHAIRARDEEPPR